MNKNIFFAALLLLVSVGVNAQNKDFNPEEHRFVKSDRPDGRFLSTYGVAHAMIRNTCPKYAFNPHFTKKEWKKWQLGVRAAMEEIMCHPKLKGQPAPKRIETVECEGYRQEKWEFYPLPECVGTFYVLVPNDAVAPRPAVMCIPGSDMSKEHLIGKGLKPEYMNMAMAVTMVKEGYIAVAVENAASGEASDLEKYAHMWIDYDTPSRMLLELGWSWLGYTSYLNKCVLNWMEKQPSIRRDRIVVSGFSLGTEPMMVLGVLDKSIYAFVYNDFLCNTQERALSMTYPDEKGRRNFPNSIRHLIPNYWKYFNFPDVAASLAPRYIIFTEGGLDRDFRNVHRSYELSGFPDRVTTYHYDLYANPADRNPADSIAPGLTLKQYLKAANVDAPNHYFKTQKIIPWLRSVLAK